ncbi:peroxidasin homolog isoform X2 [Patiria miniata]|uniref:Ig-like domain-containing protein n=1 Tax=Patiria miniata TaxID=46514 RepID=A0A913ZYR1_PATMI|nr:peroxidasin homolog isoform X2 [Patiria miniata]
MGMDSRFLVLLLGVLSVCLPAVCQACPLGCLCFRTTVRCMHLELTRIPQVDNETKILDLRFNQIAEIPPGAFSSLTALNTLLLNHNNIRRIPRGAFDGLHHLKYLYLYKNRITDIDSRAFDGLVNLEQLYLYSNEIQELKPGTFSNLPMLERLFLNNNNLTSIYTGTFQGLDSLKRLRLDANKLMCNCKLIWLIEMLKQASHQRHTQAAATCEYPRNLRSRNLMDISPEELNCRRPHFVVEPSDVDAVEGNNVYFSCRAMGDPEPEIVWLHNSVEITAATLNTVDSKYSILNDGTLMIQNASGDDEGEYECTARNAVGETTSERVNLRYFGSPKGPTFSQEPTDTEVKQGTTVTLDCSANGYPRPTIVWTRHGQSVVDDPRFTLLASGSLHISSVQPPDRGDYTCTATNQAGSRTASATLSVTVPPTFEVTPQFLSAIEGSTVELFCQATGYPLPVIAWRKDGGLLPDSRRYLSLASGTLRIVRVTREDEGNYDCYAVNSAGSIQTTAQIEVRPRVPPVFTQSPSDLQVVIRATIRLPCSASGDPTPVITWSKDGIQIPESNKYTISSEGHLVIHNISPDDEGRFECAARNSIGYAATSMLLTVDAPDEDREGDQFVGDSITQAINNVDRAINETRRELFDRSKPRTPSDLLTLFRFPSMEAMSIARAAEVFEQTLQLIHGHIESGMKVNLTGVEYTYDDLVSRPFLNLIANLSGCTTHSKIVNCSDICYHRKYRTHDGTCNNLQNPEWGASLTPFRRLLRPIYENGFNTPVGWNQSHLYNGHPKPSVRKVSLEVMSTATVTNSDKFSHMLMQWGQFLDHDMDFTVTSLSRARFSDGVECKDTCENQPPCFPINVPDDDPRIRRMQCMEFTRSSAVCGSGSTSVFFNSVMPREQINQITSYIDGSNVYGSTKGQADNLRDYTNNLGRLKAGPIVESSGKRLLPFNRDTPIDCQRDVNESPIPCFLAGDFRNNEQLGLLSLHTLWFREHNRIADELLKINPHWDGEKIFQETRKIIGASMQHISYSHWLPKVLGSQGMDLLGSYNGYNPKTNAAIVNVFATAAFRFGHSLIQPILRRLNSTYQTIELGDLPLHKAFFSPYRIVEEGGIDPILRGLYTSPLKEPKPDEMMNTELTERLFQMAHEIALDLASLNIQRGRDHALPGYNDWRVFCNMSAAQTFDDLREEISNDDVRSKLENLYHHPGNVDLFVAGLAEDPVEGALLGPTFTCILALQMKRLRAGDRFWYENPGTFEPDQLTQIKQISLARIVCDNADYLHNIPEDLFHKNDYPVDFRQCHDIPSIDLRMWAECPEDLVVSSLTVGSVSRSRRSVDKFSAPSQWTNTSTPKHHRPDKNRHKSFIAPSGMKASATEEETTTTILEELDLDERTTYLETVVIDLQDTIQTMQSTISEMSKQLKSLRKERKKHPKNRHI